MRNKLKTIFKKTNKENEEQTKNQITRLNQKNDNEKRNIRITEMLAEYCQKYPQI